MTQSLTQWAIRHGVSHVALAELRAMWGDDDQPATVTDGKSEAAVQAAVRVEWSQRGGRGYRNNVGACKDETGRVIRYGLCNESAALNKKFKSSDLVGPLPRLITADMVGTTIAQFAARECKAPGWRYTGTPREAAQLAWGQLVIRLGGDFKFVTGPGSFD